MLTTAGLAQWQSCRQNETRLKSIIQVASWIIGFYMATQSDSE